MCHVMFPDWLHWFNVLDGGSKEIYIPPIEQNSFFFLNFRCVMDDDNEVRDRATFYLSVLEQKQKALNAGYILNGI